MAERIINPLEAQTVAAEFIRRLAWTNPKRWKQSFLIVVGGTVGSGKTTVARYLAEKSGAFHVQSNSARFLLGLDKLPWGKNVHRVIHLVLEALLEDKWSIVMDGMLLGEEERVLLKNLAQKYSALHSFNLVLCDPARAEERAWRRYADKKPSGFEDWRASEEKFSSENEDDKTYITSIRGRMELVNKLIGHSPEDPRDQVMLVDNNGTVAQTRKWADPVWFHMKDELSRLGKL